MLRDLQSKSSNRARISHMKGVFVGSGSEGLQHPEVCKAIIGLTKKEATAINVLYVGTATYDLPTPKHNQTIRLEEAGCRIHELRYHETPTSPDEAVSLCNNADVIVVSGGNTLYALDLWKRKGLDTLLADAANRGAVLAGGSAGAICWFDGGHSDSADPDTYKKPMLQKEIKIGQDESSHCDASTEVKKWEYMRVPCLGLFPGLVCPHADSVQSNGVLRMTDFDRMMMRHSGERGICIDHYAALIVENNEYRVLSLPGRPGSVMPDGSWSMHREGVPGVWQKDVVDGVLQTSLVPSSGSLSILLKVADDIVQDVRLDECRSQNPVE